MQSLGLSGSTPRSEGRLKALFWPTIQNETDVDYLGQQGLWLCFVAAAFAGLTSLSSGGALFVLSAMEMVFYVLAGLGIRQRNQYAATAAFVINILSMIAFSRLYHRIPSVLSILIASLLLANVRATWLVATAKFSREAFDQDRLNSTFMDKVTDQWPPRLWPFVQWLFWILFGLELVITLLELLVPALMQFGRMIRRH